LITLEDQIVVVNCRLILGDDGFYFYLEPGIEIGRGFDRTPTDLEMIAWGKE
jgi:hypothetical protein